MSTRVVTQDDGRLPQSQNCYIVQHTLPDHQIKLSNVGIKISGSLYVWRRYCVEVDVDASNYLQKLQGNMEESIAFLKSGDLQFPCKFLPSLADYISSELQA